MFSFGFIIVKHSNDIRMLTNFQGLKFISVLFDCSHIVAVFSYLLHCNFTTSLFALSQMDGSKMTLTKNVACNIVIISNCFKTSCFRYCLKPLFLQTFIIKIKNSRSIRGDEYFYWIEV